MTKILDINGDVMVEYTYDAYGNILETTGSLTSSIGLRNSIRYRGYKYDDEIGMYYLNSRYYNPEVSRFINADGMLGEVGQLGTTNMYAYCANNTVMYIDSSGQAWWQWAVAGGLVGAYVGYHTYQAGSHTYGIHSTPKE